MVISSKCLGNTKEWSKKGGWSHAKGALCCCYLARNKRARWCQWLFPGFKGWLVAW